MNNPIIHITRRLMLAERHALVYALKSRADFFKHKDVMTLFAYRLNRRRWLERRKWVNEQLADRFEECCK